MIIAIDVHYRADHALAISIEFDDWSDPAPLKSHAVRVHEVAEYEPGEFYKREMPCILAVLGKSNLEQTELIVVDGYVQLDDDGRKGLGAHLYEALGEKIPVVGVAKTKFAGFTLDPSIRNPIIAEVFRGESMRPLYVTAIGFSLKIAAEKVKNMVGEYRFPDLLKVLDQMTKEI